MNNIKNTIERAIKKGDLHNKIFCYILEKIGYSNEKLQALEIRNKKYLKIHKKYKKYLDNMNCDKIESIENDKKDIWICWLQGYENSPEIVKCCLKSIIKYNKDKKLHIITEKNLFNYIQLPGYILEKWKKGIITNTHFSDIIRLNILIKYGGIWMDATTYLTGKIPKYIEKSEFFMFRYKDRMDKTIKYNSWFICANKENRILKTTRELLYEYWKKENKLSEYFLLHLFITMAIEKYPEDVSEMIYITDDVCHTLDYNLFEKYSNEKWEFMVNSTKINKMSYKFDKNKSKKNTFYEHIIRLGEKDE